MRDNTVICNGSKNTKYILVFDHTENTYSILRMPPEHFVAFGKVNHAAFFWFDTLDDVYDKIEFANKHSSVKLREANVGKGEGGDLWNGFCGHIKEPE